MQKAKLLNLRVLEIIKNYIEDKENEINRYST